MRLNLNEQRTSRSFLAAPKYKVFCSLWWLRNSRSATHLCPRVWGTVGSRHSWDSLHSRGQPAGSAAGIAAIVSSFHFRKWKENKTKWKQNKTNKKSPPGRTYLVSKSKEIRKIAFHSVHQAYKSNHFSLQGKISAKRRWSLLSFHTKNAVVWHENRCKDLK